MNQNQKQLKFNGDETKKSPNYHDMNYFEFARSCFRLIHIHESTSDKRFRKTLTFP